MESFELINVVVLSPIFAEMPEFNSEYIIQLVSRILHIMSAIILVGGLFYIRTILAASGNEVCYGDRKSVWSRWVGFTSGLLIATGLYNFFMINNAVKEAGDKLPSTYHMLFGIKFLLALALMFLVSILAGKTDLAKKFQSKMSKWTNVSWLIAVAIIVVAAILRTLH